MVMENRSTADDYQRVFEAERVNEYPAMDEFEREMGFALDRTRLEKAASVLACPVKVNPPNWQHGRLVYSVARRYIESRGVTFHCFLDVGTAKGFSALCLQWALCDAGAQGSVVSVDVVDPEAKVVRNTVADLFEPKQLWQILSPWPETKAIDFQKSTGVSYILGCTHRVHVAFLDGKHRYDDVAMEAALLSKRQWPGDIILFDDLQISGVEKAVDKLIRGNKYDVRKIEIKPERRYAMAVKRQ